MIADIFVQHGFYWAKSPARNPLVGGKRVRYNSFENQTVKAFMRGHFGTPLGDYVTFDDGHEKLFAGLLRDEYGAAEGPCVWKGAVEFWPLWQAMIERGLIQSWNVSVIYRPLDKVVESVLAKRQGRGSEAEARRITEKRYGLLHDLIGMGFDPIMTDEVVRGNFASIKQAWAEQYHVPPFNAEIAAEVVDPSRWEAER